jgi:signal transduction histidine kinase
LGSLLALLFLPGITALHRTEQVYREIRDIQQSRERTERSLDEIKSHMYLVSVRMRELLLDNSQSAADTYRKAVESDRRAVEAQLAKLHAQKLGPAGVAVLDKLERELDLYWQVLHPLFEWTAAERAERATWFLREQQRPRRENILAVATEISDLTDAAYQRLYAEVDASQRSFVADIQRIVAVAFLIGVGIAGGSILRISTLEIRSERQRAATEQAEEDMRLLSTELMRAQEEERRTISRELHDEVGQTLTGLRMELGTLERLRSDPEEFSVHLREAKSLAEQTLRAIRDLAVGLRPSVLDLGLVPALQWQARHFSKQSGIRVLLETSGRLDNIPEEHRTCLYRLVQESLTNCMRHSAAKSVNIDLQETERVLELQVKDDGVGFDPARARHGLGLLGIQERVRELGGQLSIDSAPGRGASLRVKLPLPRTVAA